MTASNTKANFYAHPTSSISPDAKIGDGVKVWINTQIREQANIGDDCILSKDVYIDHGVVIGRGCKIQNGVSVYSGVEISNYVFIGPYVTFTNDKVPRAFNADWKISKTYIAEGASLGANSTIVCGVEIGEYAMVAAGSVVTKSVPAYTLVMGNPARIVGRIDRHGNRILENE